MIRFPHILFAVCCIGSLFVYSYQFTDVYIVAKWCLTLLISLVLLLYICIKVLLYKSVSVNMLMCGNIIVFSCVLQALYGILQFSGLFSSHSFYKVTGSFDNPAGFASCLCAGFPFLILLLSSKNKYVRYGGWLAGTIIVTAIILSYSRAGIVSVTILSCLYLYERLEWKKVLKYLLLASLVLLLFGCYWMKKDSADGRLLIWKCCINMVKDAPWTGHGIGSFEAHYMDYQADYFKQHEQSRYSMLADNVKQPFNEYLKILLNFGIVGILVLFLLIGAIVYCYKKNSNTEKKIGFYSLISIGTFSLFSYPFTYPFVWVIAFFSIYIIIGEYIKRFFIRIWIKNIICVFVLIASIIGFYKLTERIQAELSWGKASTLARCKSYNELLPAYEILEKKFLDNPYFLYNYAAILQEMRQYSESLEVALKCRQYWADYDLELIIGENYQQLNKPDLAEEYYNSASMMCRCRFYPLYQLYELYKKNGNEKKVFLIAKTILEKPVKINSAFVKRIKHKVSKEF